MCEYFWRPQYNHQWKYKNIQIKEPLLLHTMKNMQWTNTIFTWLFYHLCWKQCCTAGKFKPSAGSCALSCKKGPGWVKVVFHILSHNTGERGNAAFKTSQVSLNILHCENKTWIRRMVATHLCQVCLIIRCENSISVLTLRLGTLYTERNREESWTLLFTYTTLQSRLLPQTFCERMGCPKELSEF